MPASETLLTTPTFTLTDAAGGTMGGTVAFFGATGAAAGGVGDWAASGAAGCAQPALARRPSGRMILSQPDIISSSPPSSTIGHLPTPIIASLDRPRPRAAGARR